MAPFKIRDNEKGKVNLKWVAWLAVAYMLQ